MGELLVRPGHRGPTRRRAEDDERLLAQFLDRVRERTRDRLLAPTSAPRSCAACSAGWSRPANPRLRDYVRYVQKHPEEYGRLSSAAS